MPKHTPGRGMMDTTALTRIPAPQQVQQNQIVSPVSLGTGVVALFCRTKGDEGKHWSQSKETGRAPENWAIMPPVRPSWYQSGYLYVQSRHQTVSVLIPQQSAAPGSYQLHQGQCLAAFQPYINPNPSSCRNRGGALFLFSFSSLFTEISGAVYLSPFITHIHETLLCPALLSKFFPKLQNPNLWHLEAFLSKEK